MRTIVLQSHTEPFPYHWLGECTDSVRAWAASKGFQYQWLGDGLFDLLPANLREKTRTQPIIAADLARLRWLEQMLKQDFERALWVDADVLVLNATALTLPSQTHGFGREVWVQQEAGKLKVYPKLHNAFMYFCQQEPVLPFYRDSAEGIVSRHRDGPMAPQIVGPKLVTALHNLVQFNIVENAAMLPPLVAQAIANPSIDAAALTAFKNATNSAPAAVNLCSSLGSEQAQLGLQMSQVIERLRAQPELLAPGTAQA